MTAWALIPVKPKAACKTRLAAILPPDLRVRLVREMLAHVVREASAADGVSHVGVITSEPDLAPAGVGVIEDPALGLNAALSHAIAVAGRAGARTVLILPADLPCLTRQDVARLARVGDGEMILARDTARGGTNGAGFRLATPFVPSFGADSFARHVADARNRSLSVCVIETAGFCDLDVPADLALLRGCGWARRAGLENILPYTNRLGG